MHECRPPGRFIDDEPDSNAKSAFCNNNCFRVYFVFAGCRRRGEKTHARVLNHRQQIRLQNDDEALYRFGRLLLFFYFSLLRELFFFYLIVVKIYYIFLGLIVYFSSPHFIRPTITLVPSLFSAPPHATLDGYYYYYYYQRLAKKWAVLFFIYYYYFFRLNKTNKHSLVHTHELLTICGSGEGLSTILFYAIAKRQPPVMLFFFVFEGDSISRQSTFPSQTLAPIYFPPMIPILFPNIRRRIPLCQQKNTL